MGTRRRRSHNQRQRVTDETVALYAAGDKTALHQALRLPPWQVSPLEAVGECPYPPRSGGGNTWAESVALRAELEAQG